MCENTEMTDKNQKILLFVIAGCSAYLLLANLGNQYLWQDEAQTALVSKTILTDGVPRGYDGKNFFSNEQGAEYGNNYIWRWHTWLPFYVLAGFYKVLGVNTFVSRLPFALFGLGTVLMTYYLARALWSNTRIAVIAAALLAVTVPFLLLCRQCRYYSMAMFFSVLALYAYVILLQNKKYASALLFVSLTLLFHSQHIYFGPIVATIWLHAIIFHRERLKILIVVTVVTIIFNGPWLIWLAGMKISNPFFKVTHQMMLGYFIEIYLDYIIKYVFPYWLFAVVIAAAVVRFIRTRRFPIQTPQFLEKISLPIFFIIFTNIVMGTLSPLLFFRYIAPAIPLLVLLIAVIIDAALEAHWLLAAAVIFILGATSQFKDYLYEITHDYDGPEEGIAKYLNEHGSPDDVAAASYGDMSLKFYTKMRVVGGLTGEDLEPAKNARWVIIRKSDLGNKGELLEKVDLSKYRKIEIDYPDIDWENREDPEGHRFRTCTDKDVDKVVIYERIN
jgi:4-amino-4-deoxy-L-arabinose transferase-like glycosyltransferase